MDQKILDNLGLMKARHTMLSGLYADKRMYAGVGEFLDKAIKVNTELADQIDLKESARRPGAHAQIKALFALVARARAGEYDAVTELNALRVTNIDNYLRATSNFLMMFERVDLAEGESPYWNSTYQEPVAVFTVGQDGGRRRFKVTKDQQFTAIPLIVLKTETPEYPTRDIYRGTQITDVAKAQFDLNFEMTNAVDLLLYNLYKGSAFGSFVTTGNKLNRTYNLHPRINSGNIPSTNDLTPADANSGTTKFRTSVIQTIPTYFDSFTGAMSDGAIGTTGAILVPSSEVNDLMSEYKPTGLTLNPSANKAILMPKQLDWNGTWTLVPDVTLPRGICYPVPTKPVGQVFFKPSMDRSRTVQTPDQPDMEWQEADKIIGSVIPEPWRIRTCRVTYHS